jgi:hypothetical protein
MYVNTPLVNADLGLVQINADLGLVQIALRS